VGRVVNAVPAFGNSPECYRSWRGLTSMSVIIGFMALEPTCVVHVFIQIAFELSASFAQCQL